MHTLETLALVSALVLVVGVFARLNRTDTPTPAPAPIPTPRLVTRTYTATEAQLPGMRRRLHQHGGRLVRSSPSGRGYVVTVALPEDVLARMEHNHAPDAEDARLGFVVFPRIGCPACADAHTYA